VFTEHPEYSPLLSGIKMLEKCSVFEIMSVKFFRL